jgi:hypothetical protein
MPYNNVRILSKMFNLRGIDRGNEGGNPPNKNSNKKANKNSNKKTGQKYKKKEYTQEQIKGLINGYIIVAPDKWADIPINSHIRYFKKDGSFVRGGFVTSHWLNKEGKPFIHVANNFKKTAKGYATWPAAHESMQRIYKKVDKKSGIEMDVVRGKTTEIVGQINKLVTFVKQLQTRIDDQDAEIKKLYLIIKKMNERRP